MTNPNMRLIAVNAGDSSTLSSSDFVAGLPVTNLQLEGRGRVARTTNATGSKTINGDFDGAAAVSACVLNGNNLTSDATWRLQIWDGAGQTGTQVYDSGTVAALEAVGWGEFAWGLSPWGSTAFFGWSTAFSVLWFPAVSGLSFRVTITDAANPAGYLEAKRLILGTAFEPAYNLAYGVQLDWQEDSVQARTEGGSIRTDPRARYRRLAGNLRYMDATDRALLMEAFRLAGLRSEIFVSVFPEVGGAKERDYSLLGKFSRMPSGVHDRVDNWNATFEILEV